MTFKHVKFEDSSVMRSLEKVAVQKGLVKPEPLTKTAMTKRADLTPSTSLTENVIKLCAGLRERGFDKYAEELELNLLNYKKAQTLYETSPEKGEDVINFAHPKGSHKLENVDSSEAVFEDILDKHVKMLDVVNKKPTGKLSTASAIDAVKKVLGQAEAANDANLAAAKKIYDELIEQTIKLVNAILRNENLSDWTYHQNDPILRSLQDNPEAGTGFAMKTTKGHFQTLAENLNNLMRQEPSMDSINELKSNLNSLFTLIGKASNIAAETKLSYTKQTREIYSHVDSVLKALRGQPQAGAPNASAPASDALTQTVQQITSTLSRLNAFKLIVNSNPQFTSNPKAKGQALKFIDDATQKMTQYKDTIGQIPQDQATSLLPAIKKYVDPLVADINQFGTSWLGVGA